ncbi:hypothetical protein BofuT4_uP104600.1 [Botrytis cinerea T4]|uniref:Uncharacterized protein n=1 Tax=Botryotinia fuckeliana (strain T4) TaxID=999810 RepID=G2YAK3_BOTF4|nr:hypothetical protein BofuT4_uP104600.1 [Botrytis cinerea T4]
MGLWVITILTLNGAEAILSAFAVFSLPSFKESWNSPDYQERFERIWSLIKQGV